MLVTKFQYHMEPRLLQKIDLMIQRCIQKNPKRDAVLLIEGEEGQGKTTLSVALGYYISEKTGRVFNHTRVFADLEKTIEFLKSTEGEICVWDEPALQALTGDVRSRIVKNLTRLLMMARKKRHFIIINLAYFNKFNDYIVWQRPLGMIHIYSRDELHAGHFSYIKKRNLERLFQDWRRKKLRNYKRWSTKHIRGTFPDVLNPDYKKNVLSDFDLDAYEKAKDEAIMKIGGDKEENKIMSKSDKDLLKLKYKIYKMEGMPNYEKVKQLKIAEKTIYEWAKIPQQYPDLFVRYEVLE